jgi:peptidyl-prolyl cis-trans isomerase D
MIAFFRRTLASKLALGLLALIMLAFIITGVFTHEMPGTTSLTGPGKDSIATVGDTSISTPSAEQRVRNAFAQYAQQQPGLDLPTFVTQGGFASVIDQLIGGTAMEAFGRSIGLVASKKQIDGQIAAVRAFQGVDGKFNRQTYLQLLAQQHVTDAQVRSDFAADTVRRMIYLPATGALTLPDGMLKAYAGLLVEQRSGTVGFVPTAAMGDGKAPTDADLQGFYKSHVAAYTTPERRVLRYALIGRDQVAAAATPSEAEIRKAYDSAPDKYAARETRDLSQVVLPDEAKAKAFKAAVASGKSFADAAKAAGFSEADIAVGDKSKAQFAAQSGPQAADAAFALADGGVSDPIKSEFGWNVVKVNKITKVAATPFDKARPEIAGDLTKSKQDAALGALLNKVQDSLDNGAGFADVVKGNGLAVTDTPALTAQGLDPNNPAYKPTPEVQPLLAPAFKAMPDDPASVQTIQQGERYAVLTLAKTVPAAPIPFAQVKDRLTQDFKADRVLQQAKAIATAIQTKVKAGTAMADAFKTASVKLPDVQKTEGRRMDLAKLQGQVPPPLAAMFRSAVGSTQLVPAPNGWYVVHVDKVTPADDKLVASLVPGMRNDVTQSANSEYLEQLSHAAEKSVGTKRNEQAIAALQMRLMGVTLAQ